MKRRALLLLFASLLSLGALSQSMYKWVDEKGVTHFSETPPPEGAKGAAKIEVKTAPQGRPAEDNWRQRDAESKQQRAKHGLEEAQARQQEEAQRPRLCDNAKSRYDQLSGPRALYRLDNKGERVFMEEKERAAELAEARADMARYCR